MSRRWWFVLGTIVVVAFFLAGVIAFIQKLRSAPAAIIEKATRKEEKTLDVTTVVTRVNELSRLETAAMRIVNVSSTTQSYGVVPQMLAGDELTFLAVGDVIAGLDLSMITPKRVSILPDGTLVMELPPPQILVTRVDNRESRVMSRKTGVLRRGDVHLESRVRARAEAAIRNEALKRGILQQAKTSGEAKLAEFLRALGAKAVRFETWKGADNWKG